MCTIIDYKLKMRPASIARLCIFDSNALFLQHWQHGDACSVIVEMWMLQIFYILAVVVEPCTENSTDNFIVGGHVLWIISTEGVDIGLQLIQTLDHIPIHVMVLRCNIGHRTKNVVEAHQILAELLHFVFLSLVYVLELFWVLWLYYMFNKLFNCAFRLCERIPSLELAVKNLKDWRNNFFHVLLRNKFYSTVLTGHFDQFTIMIDVIIYHLGHLYF